MEAGIIGLVDGEPKATEIESVVSRPFALDANATEYLDGEVVYHGTATDTVERQGESVSITEEDDGSVTIFSETEPVYDEVTVDFTADLGAGFVSVSSSDGTFLWDAIGARAGVPIERAELDLDAFREAYERRDDASVWQVGWSGEDTAGAEFHNAATLAGAPAHGLTQLGFNYKWDGYPVRGTMAASGYVAVYAGPTAPEAFARWVRDEVLEFGEIPADEQDELPGGEF